jgi:hypothetical protein
MSGRASRLRMASNSANSVVRRLVSSSVQLVFWCAQDTDPLSFSMMITRRHSSGVGSTGGMKVRFWRVVWVAACMTYSAPSPAQTPAAALKPSTIDRAPARMDLRMELARSAPTSRVAKVRIIDAAPEQLAARAVRPGDSTGERRAVAVEAGTATVSVTNGEQVVIEKSHPPAPVLKALSTIKQPLPSTVLIGINDAQGQPSVLQLQPFVVAERLPLQWDAASAAYAATLLVGLDYDANAGDPPATTLPAKVTFQITGQFVDTIEPSQVDVSVAGPTGYQRVRILTKNFNPPIEVRAHSGVGDGSFRADIDPRPTFIDVNSSDLHIDGLGLGKTSINVQQKASNGLPLVAGDVMHVALKTTGGTLAPAYADIAAGRSDGATTLMSSGWGEAIVTLGDSAQGQHQATIDFVFPWLKVLMGLAGAAAAGILRAILAARAKEASIPAFLGCLVSGIVIDILLALGVPIAPSGIIEILRSELAWFAIGAVGGYPGGSALQWLGNKIFGFDASETGATAGG